MELMEMSCRRLGEQVLRPGLHFILGPLQPSNAAAFKFSRMVLGSVNHIEIRKK
jgi:hypothetical protein